MKKQKTNDYLPEVRITLPSRDTSGNDQYLRKHWKERYIVSVHCQDERLSVAERKTLAEIGERLYGRRSVH